MQEVGRDLDCEEIILSLITASFKHKQKHLHYQRSVRLPQRCVSTLAGFYPLKAITIV